MECSGAEAQMYHHLYANLEDTLVDIRMDEDGEMRVLGVEATLDLKITIYQEEELEILEDASGSEDHDLSGRRIGDS